MRIVERTLFRASPHRVWATLADWEAQPSWMPDVAWIRLLTEERELGAKLEVRTKVFGVPLATDIMEVTAWDPPLRLEVAHSGIVRGRGEWRLTPSPGGEATAFQWIEELGMRPPLIGHVALVAYSPWERRMLRTSMANLRRRLESPG